MQTYHIKRRPALKKHAILSHPCRHLQVHGEIFHKTAHLLPEDESRIYNICSSQENSVLGAGNVDDTILALEGGPT